MINVITGRQVDNLQNEIIDQAVKSYYQDKRHDVFIIVPNHIKFTTEVRALSKLSVLTNKKQVAVNKLHILSFSRLAWYFLRDEAIKLPQILDDAASVMLLEQIVKDHQGELKLFQNQTQVTSGALRQMYEAILSVRAGNIELDNIDEKKLNEETSYKIHDLRIIYDEFIERLSEKFATKDEMQLLLNEFLAKSNNLSTMEFYFSDFSHFSLQELTSVRLISKKAKNTTLAFKTKIGKIDNNAEPGNYDYVVQRTIGQLEHFWQNQQLDYQTQEYPLTQTSPSSLLNGVWTKTSGFDECLSKFLQPVKADSRYAEAYFVARTIYQQVALNNYRYQDFLVLAPNLSEYETYLTPILRQNQIPFFNDLQREMKYHPLVVVVENLQQIFKRGFQTDNVITLMKTQLFIPDWYKNSARYQNDVDLLENFVLAHGIKGKLWTKSLKSFVDADVIALDKSEKEVEELDRLREYFIDALTKFFEQLDKEEDPQAGVTVFWNFLIKNHVAKRLESWRKEANDTGDLQLAQQPEQVWSTLTDLLKDYLLVATKFSIDQFFDLLISGFSEANFSQIPSTLDAVNISELGMVQGQGYKRVFIIGATSTNLPQIEKIPGFFSSENLEQLNEGNEANGYLEDQQKINNLDQNYQFGNALSLASDKIYISYPVINTANEQLEPSIFYKQLLKLTRADEFSQHDLPQNNGDVLTFITNPEASLGYLTYLKNKAATDIESLLDMTEEKIGEIAKNVLEGSSFKNIPQDLSPDLAQQLYGDRIETSVSQLETYYQNSFEYFLNYGLHLKKRFENELDVIQAGNYYHETFDYLVKRIKEKKLNFADLTEEKLGELLIEVREELKEKGRYRQLLNDPFNKYLFHKLDQTTANVAHYWHSNVNKTIFRPQYSELSFGKNQKVSGLSYSWKDDNNKKKIVDLRGKMDRVDLAQVNDRVLGEVIDYKSSAKKFDLGLFANGISMQMISYLEVLKNNNKFFAQGKDLDVLGAFYQNITSSLERLSSEKMILSNYQIKDLAKESTKKLMYNGILIADEEMLDLIEPGMEKDRAVSDLYTSVKRKVNGDISWPQNQSFTPDQLDLLLAYNSYLIKNAGNEILSGKIELDPYSYGQQTSLTYSDFKDIFFFDAMLKENNYHKIKSIDKKTLLTLIKEKLDLDGEE